MVVWSPASLCRILSRRCDSSTIGLCTASECWNPVYLGVVLLGAGVQIREGWYGARDMTVLYFCTKATGR